MSKEIYALESETLSSLGSKTLDSLERSMKQLLTGPIRPPLNPGELARQFSSEPPVKGRAHEFDSILEDVETKIMPGITKWQHPNFMAWYPSASSIPAILSELIVAAAAPVGLQWQGNPIGTELEVVVMDWIATMLHAPADSPFRHSSGQGGGIIQNTASESMLSVMIAARIHKQANLLRDKLGLERGAQLPEEKREETFYADSSKFVVYVGDQSHFSAFKAIRCAGMQCRKIHAEMLPQTGNYGITKAQVVAAMDEDRKKGLIPAGLILCHGFTNTCGYDLLAEFGGFYEEHDMWVHVDAAYAGSSLVLEHEKQRSLDLQNCCTSFNFNGSKAFLCGFDSAFLFVRNKTPLLDAFAATGSYLDNTEHESIYSPEFKDWAIPLGRRFRALRIWMVIEYFGVEGMRKYLQDGLDQANWLRAQVDRSDFLAQPVRTDLKLVCIEAKDRKQTQRLVDELKKLTLDDGSYLILPSILDGRPIIRVALGGANTTMEHTKALWSVLVRASENAELVAPGAALEA